MYKAYLEKIHTLLNGLEEREDAILEAGTLIGEVLADGKACYVFGSGHSQLLAREITGRAGGLYPVFHLPDPIWGMAEQLEGYGTILFQRYPMKPGEVIIIISNSGRNPEPVEFALEARKLGVKVIALTSLDHSKSSSSRHSSGKRLFEVADIILDTGTPKGDAMMQFEGMDVKAGAASTILGSAMLNCVMLEAVQIMLDAGKIPPVYLSFNVDGSEEHNAKIAEAYQEFAWAPYYFF